MRSVGGGLTLFFVLRRMCVCRDFTFSRIFDRTWWITYEKRYVERERERKRERERVLLILHFLPTKILLPPNPEIRSS